MAEQVTDGDSVTISLFVFVKNFSLKNWKIELNQNQNSHDETSSELTDASFCPHPASPPSPGSIKHFLALLRPSP